MRPSPPRSAMSLLETMIALMLFVAAIAILMESLIATRHLSSLGNAEDDLAFSSRQVMDAISGDLAESGWHFTTATNLPQTQAADRAARYYPYVQQQNLGAATGGLGSAFTYTHRDEPAVRVFATGLARLPGSLPGLPGDAERVFGTARAAYLASFAARSQELIFVRQATRGWVADPGQRSPPTIPFDRTKDWSDQSAANRRALGVLYPSGWESTGGSYRPRRWDVDGDNVIGANEGDSDLDGLPDVPYGRPLLAGELFVDGNSLTLLPLWETLDQPDYDADTVEEVRDYTYAVVPSPVGLGRLVRAFKVRVLDEASPSHGFGLGQLMTPYPTAEVFGMKIDRVLSDDVTRVVFDTFRTDASLDINQVRVRIYLARQSVSQPELVVYRVADSVVALRAKVSDADRTDDIGRARPSVGFSY
jgi:hypothetical protein